MEFIFVEENSFLKAGGTWNWRGQSLVVSMWRSLVSAVGPLNALPGAWRTCAGGHSDKGWSQAPLPWNSQWLPWIAKELPIARFRQVLGCPWWTVDLCFPLEEYWFCLCGCLSVLVTLTCKGKAAAGKGPVYLWGSLENVENCREC